MIDLLLAIGFSLGVAVIFKIAELRRLDRMALLTANYGAAAALALSLQRAGPPSALPSGLLPLATAQGVLFIAGYWLFALAIRQAGVGLATAVMRLSVVIPVLASWLVWGEVPGALQLVGLVLGATAFVLVTRTAPEDPGLRRHRELRSRPPRRASAGKQAPLVLVALFLASGAVDTIMKAFGVHHAGRVDEATFLLVVFGVALLIGAAAVVRARLAGGRWPGPRSWALGALLGVVNYGSANFLLRAVAALSGPVVFPTNGVAILLGAALLGAAIWGERPSRAGLAGLALAAVALVCLTV